MNFLLNTIYIPSLVNKIFSPGPYDGRKAFFENIVSKNFIAQKFL